MSRQGIEERVQIIKAGLDADMSYSDIARQIGITCNAVAGIIHRHLRGVDHMPAPVEPEPEAAITAEVVSDTAEPVAEPITSDLGLPVFCDMRIRHELGDFDLALCSLVSREGETEVYRAQYCDDRTRATPSLRDASLVADGRDPTGKRTVMIRDVDVQIKRHRHPWYHVHISPREEVDLALLRGALAEEDAADPIVRQIDSLPIDGTVVSVDLPNGTNLLSIRDYFIHSYPNRVAFARRDRSDSEAVRRVVAAVRTSDTMLTSVVVNADNKSIVLRDVAVEIYSEARDFGIVVRSLPHRDLQLLMDTRQQIKSRVIDDEDLRDAYHAARRSEGFIRRSRIDVGIDKAIDLAQRRGVVGKRTMDDIDAHTDRPLSPIIEKQRAQREKADRR